MIAQNTDHMVKMAMHGQRMWLLDLPDEILVMIMSFLGHDTHLDAKLVCKRFNDLCDQFVYQQPRILKGRTAVQLSHAFMRNRSRLNWVQSLLVSTRFGEDSGLKRLPPHISEMRNLQILRLETPDCNSRQPEERVDWISLQDTYESIFKQSSLMITDRSQRKLPHLRECTLHFVDVMVELYSLTRYAFIFLHPNLKSLTLSCASTDLPEKLSEALGNPAGLQRSTDLEHLFLEECDIYAPSLAYLLKFPRALKSFKFSEGVRYDGVFRSGSRRLHGNVGPHHLMDALTQSCSESLESLSLTLGYYRQQTQNITDHGQFLNITRMAKLKFLEVDNNTLRLIRPRPQCDHKTNLRLPQSLETFKISNIHLSVHLPFETRREPHIPLEPCILREKAKHGIPNLTTIIYSYDFTDDEDEYNDMDDILLLGNGQLPMPGVQGNDVMAGPGAQQGTGTNNINAGVNLGNLMAGPPNPPVHPPQPPVVGGYVPAHLTNNLNVVNPGNLNQAQQFLRQHWFTHANRSRVPVPRMQREFTHLEMSKIALLRILNNDLLPQFRRHNTRLIVDMVKLPIGFIPPYLFPEDKPITYAAWWDSNEAKETEIYKREFRLAREARVFEQNLRRERERRRIEDELHDRRQRIRRGEDLRHEPLNFLTPQEQQAWRDAVAAEANNNMEDGQDVDVELIDDDYYDGYEDDDDDDDDADDDIFEDEEDSVSDEDMGEIPLILAQTGILTPEDNGSNHETEDMEENTSMHVDSVGAPSTIISSTRATAGDESEEETHFVDAHVSFPPGI